MSSALPLPSPAAAPRTPAAMLPHLEAARVQALEARARRGGQPPSMLTSDTAGACGAGGGRPRLAALACTLASIAARNRGIETRPAR